MTREEAIEILENTSFFGRTIDDIDSAIDKAIKALEREPCEDCISRQAVLALAKEECDTAIIPYRRFVKDINALPPVTPQPKTGHWIVEVWNNKEHHTCSSCQHVVDCEPCYHYCPYCGAKMKESEG